jgi:hypothetical protein
MNRSAFRIAPDHVESDAMQAGGIVKRPTRRKFFQDCGKGAVGLSSFSLFDGLHRKLAAAPQSNVRPASSDWRALTADLEMRLPALLAQASTVPAVSMALVADAKLLWHGALA